MVYIKVNQNIEEPIKISTFDFERGNYIISLKDSLLIDSELVNPTNPHFLIHTCLKSHSHRSHQITKYEVNLNDSPIDTEDLKLLTYRLCYYSYQVCGPSPSPMVLSYCERLIKFGMRVERNSEGKEQIEVMVIHPKFEGNKTLFFV